MLSFTGSLKVFIALEPVDMRAGINTLQALVSERLKGEVRGGALFVFTNKQRRLIKILYWDGTGMWLMLKRLEQGTFFWPRAARKGRSNSNWHPKLLRCSLTVSTCTARTPVDGMSAVLDAFFSGFLTACLHHRMELLNTAAF